MVSCNICGGHNLRIVIEITMLLILLNLGIAGAATLTVGGGANYARIQDAIDNATTGDMIEVINGSYIEHIVISKDNISVKGSDAIINSGGSGAAVLLDGANNITFSNFTLLNDPAAFFASVYSYTSNLAPAAYGSQLPNNYSLVLMAIDAKATPKQAWLQLSNGSGKLDDRVVAVGETFETEYGIWPNYTRVLNATAEAIFSDHNSVDFIILNNTYLYSGGVPVLSNARLVLVVGGSMPVLYTAGGADLPLKEGYRLAVGGVDTKSAPRQAWIRLSKDGTVLEEKVLSEGETYSYYKNGYLILTSKVDSLFSSGNLWAAGFSQIYQYSESSHNLLPNEPVYMFKNADVYSKNNWSMYENYNISVIGVDENAPPKKVWLRLSKNDMIVDDKIISIKGNYNYSKNGSMIINADIQEIFRGFDSAFVMLSNVYQYSDITHSLLIDNTSHSYIAGNPNAVNWSLYQGYALSAMDIDSNLAPSTMWQRLTKNGSVLDDKILSEKEVYTYSGSNGTVLSARIDTIFDGENSGWINITDVYQNDENTGDPILSNASHAMIFSDTIKGETWSLYEGYAITPIDIEARNNPRRAWLRLTSNNITVDEKAVKQGDNYTYYKAGQLIFTGYVDSIFAGATANMIQFRYVRQYSEIDGRPLIEFGNNASDTKTLSVSFPGSRSKYSRGLVLNNTHDSKISNNFIKSYLYGIYLKESSSNIIYNNFFNNTNNFVLVNSDTAWNVTKTMGKNIVGGPYLGGNVWANPNSAGFSQTCADDNTDGICDSNFTLDNNNIDYLPLALVTAGAKGDLNGNGQSADAGDLVLMKRASIGEIVLS